jgi:3-deoxy-D-manno-octulosonic-acid transferase
MLSRVYYYATLCYVGGGFRKSGIHNTLEAVVFGKPVLFGPNYQKFREARELIEEGAAFSVSDTASLKEKIHRLLEDLPEVSRKAKDYVQRNSGATKKILNWIQIKRLLTRE